MAPTCCAVDCIHNEKNFDCKLKRFPSDEERAKIWENNTKRDQWERKKWHKLCSCHFDDDQWEIKNGKKTLRRDAVPLVFSTHNIAGQVLKKRKYRRGNVEDSLPQSSSPPVTLDGSFSGLDVLSPDASVTNEATAEVIHNQVEPESENERKLKKKIEELEAKLQQKTEDEHELWKKMNEQKKKLENTEEQLKKIKTLVSKIFNEDQLIFLTKGNVRKWTKETIKTSLQIRFAVGISGYKFLLELGYPLPSYSSLCRRIQKIPLDCGVSDYTVELMKAKAPCLNESSRRCILSLDEMEITPKTEFDPGLRKTMGNVTLGETSGKANKLLILVARGISTKWKQVIGWHLTDGHSAKGELLWSFVKKGIEKLESATYMVEGFVSDMGPSNQSLWAYLGVKVGSRAIPHPVHPEDLFYIFADVPHVLKNLRSGALAYGIFLPLDVVEKNNLPTDRVSMNWVTKLMDLEKDPKITFKVAPHLSKIEVTNPNHWQKMRVCHAQTLMSDETAIAIEVCVKKALLSPEALTTAWFIRQVAQWYRDMNSRHITTSITIKNFDRKKTSLLAFADLVCRMSAADNKWKPYQTGIILSTFNAVALAEKLLIAKKCLRFFLTSRLTQDALENIFSVVRSRGCTLPTPLQALRAVRLIAAAQFTREVKGGNYDVTEDHAHLEFLQSPAKKRKIIVNEPSGEEQLLVELPSLGALENDSLDHFTGYAVASCLAYACDSCKVFSVKDKNDRTGALKTMLSDKGGLTYPTDATLLAGRYLERCCRTEMEKPNSQRSLDSIMRRARAGIIGSFLPQCTCRFCEEFCLKFARSRIYFQINTENARPKPTKKLFASKSGETTDKRKR